MPLETLAIIKHVQCRLNRTFTPAEIEAGILKDLITDEDYDIIKVVSTYLSSINPNLQIEPRATFRIV